MIYELMPLLYIIIGCAAAINLPEILGKSSGVLLISAALIIIHLRLKFRQEKAEYIEDILNCLLKKQANVRKSDLK